MHYFSRALYGVVDSATYLSNGDRDRDVTLDFDTGVMWLMSAPDGVDISWFGGVSMVCVCSSMSRSRNIGVVLRQGNHGKHQYTRNALVAMNRVRTTPSLIFNCFSRLSASPSTSRVHCPV